MDKKDRIFSDFNKEIFFGEVGAILGAAIVSAIVSNFTSYRVRIAQFAVIGSIMGAGTFFLTKKARNKLRRGEPIVKSIFNDLKYFTPAAAVIGIFIGYPAIYYLMKYLVKAGWHTFTAGAVAEIAGFTLFICCINLYKFALYKMFKKNIG